jgi:hypothetical protein
MAAPSRFSATFAVPAAVNGQTSDAGGASLVKTIEMPFRLASLIVSSVATKLFLFSVVLVIVGTHIAFSVGGHQCDGVSETVRLDKEEGAGVDVFGGLKQLNKHTGKFVPVTGTAIDDWESLEAASGIDDGDNAAYAVFSYTTANPVNCLHAARGGRDLIMVLSIMMTALFAVATLYMLYKEIMAMRESGATFQNVVSTISNVLFGLGTTIGCVLMYNVTDHLHTLDAAPTHSAHRKAASQLLFMSVITGMCFGSSFLVWLLNTLATAKTLKKMIGTAYYQYVPKYLIGDTSVSVQDGTVGAHPLPIMSSMRIDQAFSVGFFSAVFIAAYMAYTIKTYHTDGTHPQCTNCYHIGSDGSVQFFTAGNALIAPGEGGVDADLTAALEGTFRVSYTGTGTLLWLMSHHFKGFGTGAIVAMCTVAVMQGINLIINLVSMWRQDTASHDKYDAIVYFHREQRIPQIFMNIAATLVTVSLPMLVYDAIYTQQNMGEDVHYDALDRITWFGLFIALSGAIGITVFGVLGAIEWASPTALKMTPTINVGEKISAGKLE